MSSASNICGALPIPNSDQYVRLFNQYATRQRSPLGAFQSNKALATTSEVNLQRGKVFSVFAIDVGGEPRLVVAENRVDTSV